MSLFRTDRRSVHGGLTGKFAVAVGTAAVVGTEVVATGLRSIAGFQLTSAAGNNATLQNRAAALSGEIVGSQGSLAITAWAFTASASSDLEPSEATQSVSWMAIGTE